MTLLIIVAALWVVALLVLVAMVRRHPIIRHRCRWCGDTFWERPECDQHEVRCPGNPVNQTLRRS